MGSVGGFHLLRMPQMMTHSDSAEVCTASVTAARPALAALADLGIDAGPALRSAGLSRQSLAAIDNRLPFANVRQLWEAAARAAGDHFFGVHVAEKLPVGALDLLDYLASAAANVGEGLSRVARYVRLIYDCCNFQLFVEPPVRFVRTTAVPAPQYDEFFLALVLVRSRRATGSHWAPELVTFQHARDDNDGELFRVFHCPVVFSAAQVEMRFAADVLELRHIHADSRLLDVLTRYADSLLKALPPLGDPANRVRSVLFRQMANELPTLSSTAAALRLSERSLQRRLAQAGTSHSQLVDDVRRTLALEYIGDTRLAIAEIAFLLHYADATAFHRAFRRWTGQTPVESRNRLFSQPRSPLPSASSLKEVLR
jgi:AraC-like DNA-binding protein